MIEKRNGKNPYASLFFGGRCKECCGRLFCVGISTLILSLATGCSMAENESGLLNINENNAALSMEQKAIIEYTIPTQNPGIIVDFTGYGTNKDKIAYVYGANIPDSVDIISKTSGKKEYQISVGKVIKNDDGTLTGKLDFSDFVKNGEYYLAGDILGHSLDFSVSQTPYEERFKSEIKELTAACKEKKASASQVLALLQACEWNSDLLEDLKLSDEVYNSVKIWISEMDSEGPEGSLGHTYVALLAKFSYIYRLKDSNVATECIQRASSLYSQCQASLPSGTASFRALTELYRASGKEEYALEIEKLGEYLDGNDESLQDEDYLYGIMTYLSTRQKINRQLCKKFMSKLLLRGEKIQTVHSEMLSIASPKNEGIRQLHLYTTQLMCVNYVLGGYKYNSMLDDYVHYLDGRNGQSYVFWDDESFDGICLSAWMARLENNNLLN